MKENEIPLRLHPTNSFTKFRKEEIEQSISARFEQLAAKYPDHIAVNSKEQSLSYAELNKAANHLAQAVLSLTTKENTPVALLLDQGIPFITGILGVLKAGKIFVPLDPDYPLLRNKYMLEDSQADFIVTNKRSFSLAVELTKNKKRLLNIDDIDFSHSIKNPCLSLTPDTLSYILYTSGSTGKPKGVVQNHRNVLHNVMRHVNAFHICPEDRLSLLYPCSVYGGMRDVFNALLTGAALYHFPLKEQGISPLADWLIQKKITIYCSVATVFRYFASELSGEKEFPELRLVKLGGECVYRKDVELFKKHFSSECLLSCGLAGTERGTVRQFFIGKHTTITGNIALLGYPVEDMEVLLIDDSGRSVDGNDIGEITVKSRYIALSYWRKPQQTQEVFLPDPEGGGKRIYHTGDLGRRLPGDQLVHMGRKDFQVKIRGNRVEVHEIEKALCDQKAIKEAVVVAQKNRQDVSLVAYLVAVQENVPTISELRNFLSDRLPDFMIPSVFIYIDKIPLTPNGKIDRKALSVQDRKRPELGKESEVPGTSTEIKLAVIWRQLLNLKDVGVNDNFFELGGHSLIAAQLISRIRDAFQVDLPLRMVFESPVIAVMALKIAQIKEKAGESEELDRLLDELEGLSDEEVKRSLYKE